jgi:hypothetical protein
VRGQAFGNLLPQRVCRCDPRRPGVPNIGPARASCGFTGNFGDYRVLDCVKQCGAHFAQTQTHFREIV